MKTWKDKHTVTLTVEQWLYIQSALRDAQEFNTERSWNASASVIERVGDRLGAQIKEEIDEAMIIDEMEMEARHVADDVDDEIDAG